MNTKIPESRVGENYRRLREEIQAAAVACGRDPEAVTLVAVSKGVSVAAIEEARRAGIADFGENRYQEARAKIDLLGRVGRRWHFIGRIQTNKVRPIFDAFDFIQSVDRREVFEAAERHLAVTDRRRDVLMQVNISDERTKAGFSYNEAAGFLAADADRAWPHLNLRGFMGIGPASGAQTSRGVFREFRRFFDAARGRRPDFNVLSMGMSGDFAAAIEEGTTMLRIGTHLFGGRG